MPSIKNIKRIGPNYKEILEKAGITTTEALLQQGATLKGSKEIAEKTWIPYYLILEWVNLVDLLRVSGINEENSYLLEEAGVYTISKLARRNPEKLFIEIIRINNNKKFVKKPPTLSDIEDWIEQAKILPNRITVEDRGQTTIKQRDNTIAIFSIITIVILVIIFVIVSKNTNNASNSNLSIANDAKAGIETTLVLTVVETTQAAKQTTTETIVKAVKTTTSISSTNENVTTKAPATTTTTKAPDTTTTTKAPATTTTTTKAPATTTTTKAPATTTTIKTTTTQIDSPTLGEKNAARTALNYLAYAPFSYSGLVEQLKFEGYTQEESVYGVDRCGADWNEQAARTALNYLAYTPFSYSGLVEQLNFEGYTQEEAVYGVDKCGADWNGQAALMAENYLNYSSFSRNELIAQLEFEGFTRQQAEYGVQAVGF